MLVLEGLGGVLVGLAVLATRGFRIPTDAGGTLAAVATGVCGLGGAYFFLLALERGKASIIVPFTALYPLITLALCVLLLGERGHCIRSEGGNQDFQGLALHRWGNSTG